MNWVNLFTSFEGRISRQPFWIAWAILIAVDVTVWLVTQQFNDDRIDSVADLVMIYPQFAVCAKRGHDRNTPAWVVGAFFVLVAIFDLLVLGGWISGSNLARQTPLVTAIVIPIGIFALVLIVDLGFRRGTVGPNRYGPDPLDSQA